MTMLRALAAPIFLVLFGLLGLILLAADARAQGVLSGVTTDPEVTSALAELAVALMALVTTVVLPMAAMWFKRWTGIQIEGKHQAALERGAASFAEMLIRKGGKEASEQAVADLKAYLRHTYPDAMALLLPTAEGLTGILTRALADRLKR